MVKVILEERPPDAQPFKMPTVCPVCETELVRPAGEKVTRCPNPECFGSRTRGIQHFAGKSAMDIDGLGEKIVQQLVEVGLVKEVSDLYQLTEDDLIPLERFAEKSAQNIISAIKGSKEIAAVAPDQRPGDQYVGEATAQLLAQHFQEPGKIDGSQRRGTAARGGGGGAGGVQHQGIFCQ